MIDVSRRLGPDTPVWPGDTPYRYQLSWSMEETGSVNVGQVEMSVHTGTHVDAPYHFDSNGEKMIDLPLDIYMGKAIVLDVSNATQVTASLLEGFSLDGAERVLLKTDTWKEGEPFPETIPSIHPDAASYLASHGVRLLGVDVPSVDPLDSKELAAHHALHTHSIHILEGLNLEGVTPGLYELTALPLPIVEGDGSPVRAVLRYYE